MNADGDDLQQRLRRVEELLRALESCADPALRTVARELVRALLNLHTAGLAQNSSVHDWKPALPVRLFHGREDETVPYEIAVSALRAMRAQGAGDLVSVTDCTTVRASHTGCVPSFLNFMLGQAAQYVKDL